MDHEPYNTEPVNSRSPSYQFSLRSMLCFMAAAGGFIAMMRQFHEAGIAVFAFAIGVVLIASGIWRKERGQLAAGLSCAGLGALFLLAYFIEEYWIWAYVNLYRHPVLATGMFLGAAFSAGAAAGASLGLLSGSQDGLGELASPGQICEGLATQRPIRSAIVGGLLAVTGILLWGAVRCVPPSTM